MYLYLGHEINDLSECYLCTKSAVRAVQTTWFDNPETTIWISLGFSTHLCNTSYCINICFSLHTSSSEWENSFGRGSVTQSLWTGRRNSPSAVCPGCCEHKEDSQRFEQSALPSPFRHNKDVDKHSKDGCHLCRLIYLQYKYWAGRSIIFNDFWISWY